MRLLRKIFPFFIFENTPKYLENSGLFPQLNIEYFLKKYKIEKEGEESGKHEMPSSDELDLDLNQKVVVNAVKTEQMNCFKIASRHIDAYMNRLSEVDLCKQKFDIQSISSKVTTKFKNETDIAIKRLLVSKEDLKGACQYFTAFRDEHAINKPESYQHSHLFHISLILIMLSIEIVLNGTFIGMGLEQGLIGGIGVALSLSFINIGFGFLSGFIFLRYLKYRNILIRLTCCIFLVLYIVGIIAFNFGIGFYRDLSAQYITHVTPIQIIKQITQNPFGMKDTISLILVIIGSSFSFIAMIDGYFFDDTYPGYGAVSRKKRIEIENYLRQSSNFTDYLNKIRDRSIDKLAEVIRDIANDKRSFRTILSQANNLLVLFNNHQNYLNDFLNNLLLIYRRKNQSVRKTEPPVYFSKSLSLSKIQLNFPEVSDLEVIDIEAKKLIAFLEKEMDFIKSEYDNMMKKFKKIDKFFEEEIEK